MKATKKKYSKVTKKKQDLLKSKRKQSPEYGPHKLSNPQIFNDASNIKYSITKQLIMKEKKMKNRVKEIAKCFKHFHSTLCFFKKI